MKIKQLPIILKLHELSCKRISSRRALEAAIKGIGYSVEDLRCEITEELQNVPLLDSGNGEGFCPYVCDIFTPSKDDGEWKAIVQGSDRKLYCVTFKISGDHEVEIVGQPKEVERTTDYEYVNEMETEAKKALGITTELQADFRGNQHKTPGDVAEEHSAAARVASRSAYSASRGAKDKGGNDKAASLHEAAAAAHETAATKHKSAGNDDDADDHALKAEKHKSLAADHKAKIEAIQTRERQNFMKGYDETRSHHPIDCANKSANEMRTVLPTEDGVIMYMPGGVHSITPSQDGKPVTVTVEVDAKSADAIEQQRKALESGGKKPFFSVQHETEIAAFWPSKFFWDKRIDATGSLVEGVWAEGEWSKSGREAVEGKDFRTFSPTFFVDSIRNDPDKPCRIVCNKDARANMGALENDPAFQDISPLWARNGNAGVRNVTIARKHHDALVAQGRNPSIEEVQNDILHQTGKFLSEQDICDGLMAGKQI